MPLAPLAYLTANENCVMDMIRVQYYDRMPTRSPMCCFCIPLNCCGPPVIFSKSPRFYCASCGYSQQPNSRKKTITPAAVAVAVCIYKDFIPYYDPASGPIKACRSCYDVASKALCLTRFAFSSAAAFKDSRHTGRAAEERPTAIAIGSGLNRRTLKETLLRVVEDLDTSHVNMSNLPKVALHFSVVGIVDVAPRTGPNQNKQGGQPEGGGASTPAGRSPGPAGRDSGPGRGGDGQRGARRGGGSGGP